MPYIKQERRTAAKAGLNSQDVGELNYSITMLIQDYLKRCGATNYAALNGVIGVLECAKQELYRRMVAPYEDKKMRENGDVYP